jgi:signal transduction histidine kinase
VIDADDLAMLATGFESAMRDSADPGALTLALFDLGWGEVLAAAPAQAVAMAFTALGATGATAGLLDDVIVHSLGLHAAPTTAVVLPAPSGTAPPGRRAGNSIALDGTASTRLERATTAVVTIGTGVGAELRLVDASTLRIASPQALDPAGAYRRVRVELDRSIARPAETSGSWEAAIAAGRIALAHELVAAARTMLDQARQHALDRVQFERPVASFQAVRHRLAEALVAIEGAAAVLDATGDDTDPLLPPLAKSLAGQAARTTATHAQQVLAGVGFTADHSFHRWLKRSLVLDALLGSSTSLPSEIGREMLRRRHAPRLVEL